MANFYTVTKEIRGKKYVAQFSGISTALKAVDNSYIEGTNNTSTEKLAKYLFENIIVEPKGLSADDFGADKVGTEETKTINGVEYTAKFDGLSAALKAVDESYIEGTNNTSTEKLAEYLFKNVVVKPEKLTADDFESMEDFNSVISFARDVMQGGDAMKEFNEVISFAREVMSGNFRKEKSKKSAKATGKE